MKIRPVAAELFRVDRRTDRNDEANNRFSQFYERAQKIGCEVHGEVVSPLVMMVSRGEQAYFHSFLASPLDAGEGSVTRVRRFNPGNSCRYPVGEHHSRSGLFEQETRWSLPGFEPRIAQPTD